MAKQGYDVYTSYRDKISRTVKKGFKLTKKETKSDDFTDKAISMFIQKGLIKPNSIETVILMDEMSFVDFSDHRLYLPSSRSLLDALWRAKMDLTMEDFDPPCKSFMIAFPRGYIVNGIKLPGVLVTFASGEDRREVFNAYSQKFYEDDKVQYSPGQGSNRPNLHITYQCTNNTEQYMRFSIPDDEIAHCLCSAEAMYERIGMYDQGEMLMLEPNEDDIKAQYVIARMVVNLIVYIQACPEAVLDGFPDNFNASYTKSRYMPPTQDTVIGNPDGKTQETPGEHWRAWHFRRHPKRKDGTRKNGPVFVRGTMVNADIKPKTVTRKKGAL